MKNVFVKTVKNRGKFFKLTMFLNNEGNGADVTISSDNSTSLITHHVTFAEFLKTQGYEEEAE